MLRARAPRGKALPPLLFFSDPWRTPDLQAAVGSLPIGSAVVFRTFGLAAATSQGKAIARLARSRGVLFFVGADIGLATRLRADGVHLPQRDAHRAGVVRQLRRRFVVTAAAHDLPACLRARRAGVDALVISPVFASASPSAGRPLGSRRLAVFVRAAPGPAYALGGINARTARGLSASGLVGLAAVEALMGETAEARPFSGSELEGGFQPHPWRGQLRLAQP